MTESTLLHGLVSFSFVVAPHATSRLFLRRSKSYETAHVLALLGLVVSAALDVRPLAWLWLPFCAFGFALHLSNEGRGVLSVGGVARCIPFVFSLVSATWFVAARNDLKLLGYPPTWSFYAALHGSVLGWLVIGCTAYLASREKGPGLYSWSCYLTLPLFLLVAFGIDQVPSLKRIGAVGLSLLVPLVLGRFALGLRGAPRRSMLLALSSVLGVVVSMTLALFNEFWEGFPRILLGMPTMVLLHGSLNALVVGPAFFLAIASAQEGGPGGARAS